MVPGASDDELQKIVTEALVEDDISSENELDTSTVEFPNKQGDVNINQKTLTCEKCAKVFVTLFNFQKHNETEKCGKVGDEKLNTKPDNISNTETVKSSIKEYKKKNQSNNIVSNISPSDETKEVFLFKCETGGKDPQTTDMPKIDGTINEKSNPQNQLEKTSIFEDGKNLEVQTLTPDIKASAEKGEKCNECGKWFQHRQSLSNHLRESVCTNEVLKTEYHCDFCSEKFTLMSNVYRHMSSYHKIKMDGKGIKRYSETQNILRINRAKIQPKEMEVAESEKIEAMEVDSTKSELNANLNKNKKDKPKVKIGTKKMKRNSKTHESLTENQSTIQPMQVSNGCMANEDQFEALKKEIEHLLLDSLVSEPDANHSEENNNEIYNLSLTSGDKKTVKKGIKTQEADLSDEPRIKTHNVKAEDKDFNIYTEIRAILSKHKTKIQQVAQDKTNQMEVKTNLTLNASDIRETGPENATFSDNKENSGPANANNKSTKMQVKESRSQKLDCLVKLEAGTIKNKKEKKKEKKLSTTQSKKLKCNQCDKKFIKSNSLIRHLNFHEHKKVSKNTNESNSSLKCYACQHCGKSYKRRDSLKVHVDSHSGLISHCCPQCKKDFKYKSTLNVHIKEKHLNIDANGAPANACQKCDKKFRRKHEVADHVKFVHEKVFNHSCSVCSRPFERQKDLRTHFNSVHLKLRLYPCTLCEKKFSISSQLYTHVRSVHEKRRDFLCIECGGAFSCKVGLEKHRLTVHLKLRSFTCDQCGQTFARLSGFRHHLKNTHTAHICQVCGQNAGSKRSLYMHRVSKGGCTPELHLDLKQDMKAFV